MSTSAIVHTPVPAAANHSGQAINLTDRSPLKKGLPRGARSRYSHRQRAALCLRLIRALARPPILRSIGRALSPRRPFVAGRRPGCFHFRGADLFLVASRPVRFARGSDYTDTRQTNTPRAFSVAKASPSVFYRVKLRSQGGVLERFEAVAIDWVFFLFFFGVGIQYRI